MDSYSRFRRLHGAWTYQLLRPEAIKVARRYPKLSRAVGRPRPAIGMPQTVYEHLWRTVAGATTASSVWLWYRNAHHKSKIGTYVPSYIYNYICNWMDKDLNWCTKFSDEKSGMWCDDNADTHTTSRVLYVSALFPWFFVRPRPTDS